ncbi:MAG: D-arabinono-1,4-lactone oxidase [Saprospiraceae bacterium]
MTYKSIEGSQTPTSPTWWNWSGNLEHLPPSDGTKYYFTPSNSSELKYALSEAKKAGATIRVSGQRHSQPPLVIDDNRSQVPQTTTEFLVDLSCYADLGPNEDQRILLGPGKNQVTINTGVREDDLEAFLTANNLMMKTVTAGGFFSLGGMVAVDVHGATLDSSIFAEDIAEFKIILADESTLTINAQSPLFPFGHLYMNWKPLQFARVSLGGLGVVTSIVLNVLDRPYATTLLGKTERLSLFNKSAFVSKFKTLLSQHDRIETFFTPYAAAWGLDNFLVLWWDVVDDPAQKLPNIPSDPKTACTLAHETPPKYGAPYLQGIAQFGSTLAEQSQYFQWADNPLAGPAVITAVGRDTIERDGNAANLAHSDLWLNGAVAVIFMSYFIPMPNVDDAGFEVVWDSIDVVTKRVLPNGHFHIAAPMEFRFVKGGDSAMSGAYSDKPDVMYVNQDLIAFVKPGLQASEYPALLLQFFADVERDWVAMGGIPHNGKMYGFYDPKAGPGTYSASGPFNTNFLAELKESRGVRLEAYQAYRKSLDPNGLFYNKFLRNMLEPK